MPKVGVGRFYGSIPHLPNSRMDRKRGDFSLNPGQTKILTEKARRGDAIVVTEKVDGTCVGVLMESDGNLLAINRAGYLAQQSPWQNHQLFAHWVRQEEQQERFRRVLKPGHRIMGEWCAQAHGTIYTKLPEPFIAFDIFEGDRRITFGDFTVLRMLGGFHMPCLLAQCAISVEQLILETPREGYFGATDGYEGFVYRCETWERNAKAPEFNFIAKWVRPDKTDGLYLPEVSGKDAIWLWRPTPSTEKP